MLDDSRIRVRGVCRFANNRPIGEKGRALTVERSSGTGTVSTREPEEEEMEEREW